MLRSSRNCASSASRVVSRQERLGGKAQIQLNTLYFVLYLFHVKQFAWSLSCWRLALKSVLFYKENSV